MDAPTVTYIASAAAVIASAVAVIAVVFAYLTIKKNEANNRTNQNEVVTTLECEERDNKKAVTEKRSVDIRPDNVKSLDSILHYCERYPPVFAKRAANFLASVFVSAYAEAFTEAQNDYQVNGTENTLATLLDYMEALLDLENLGTIQLELEKKYEEQAELILGFYSAGLADIFECVNGSESLKQRYSLTADIYADQKHKIKVTLGRNFQQSVHEAEKANNLRLSLRAEYPNFKALCSDSSDLGGLAKWFASGALAVASPFVGIPALVALYDGDKKKDERSSHYFDSYYDKFGEYVEKLSTVSSVAEEAIEKASEYVFKKSEELNCQATMQIVRELDQRGLNLANLEKGWTSRTSWIDDEEKIWFSEEEAQPA